MFAQLNDRQTFWLLFVVLIGVFAFVNGIVSALRERSERYYRDMDSVRGAMSYQAYVDARKIGVYLLPPCSNSAAATPVGTDKDTGETRWTDTDGLVRVDPITDVRTNRPTPRPIRDNPQG